MNSAAQLAMRGKSLSGSRDGKVQGEGRDLELEAGAESRMGLNFFASYHDDLCDDTEVLLNALKENPGARDVADELETRFRNARKRTSDIHEKFPGTASEEPVPGVSEAP